MGWLGGVFANGGATLPAHCHRCGSSVAEHTLGKGEVESSILSHSTIRPNQIKQLGG